MAQVIYTGQNAGTPLRTGQAIQAASQYAQQQQVSKRDELNLAIKGREQFLKLLENDPVYVASTEAREQIRKAYDEYVTKWTDVNMKSKGKMSTTDMAQMQKDRAIMVAYQEYQQGIQDEVIAGYKMLPYGKIDPEQFYNGVEYWNKNGVAPPEGFLSPPYVDPLVLFAQNETATKQESSVARVVGGLTHIDKNITYSLKDDQGNPRPVTNEDREIEGIRLYREDEYVHGIAVEKKYKKILENNPTEASSLQEEYFLNPGKYNNPQEVLAARDAVKTMWQDQVKAAGTRNTETDKNGYVVNFNNGWSFGTKDKDVAKEQEDIKTSTIGEGKGVAFTQPNVEPIKGIPVSKINLSGITLTEADDNITAIPISILYDSNKIELVPIGTKFSTPKQVTTKLGEMPPIEFKKGLNQKRSLIKDAEGKVIGTSYSWEEPKKGVSTWANVDDVMALLDASYPGFKDAYNKQRNAYLGKSGTKTNSDKYKGKIFLYQGSSYGSYDALIKDFPNLTTKEIDDAAMPGGTETKEKLTW